MAGAGGRGRRARRLGSAVLGGTAAGAVVAAAATSTVGVVLSASAVLTVFVVLVVRERRRRREGRRPRVPEDPPSWFAAWALACALYLVVGTALGSRPSITPVLVAVFVAGTSGLWPRLRRRDEAVVRSARPDGVLVRGAVDADASLPMARWAKSAAVPLPVPPTFDLLLVGLPQGLELWASERRGRPPQRVVLLSWDDVDLRRAPAPEPQLGWGAVLVLRGARTPGYARGVRRERPVHEVPLRLYDGASPAITAEAADALVAALTAPRPARPVDAVGDLG